MNKMNKLEILEKVGFDLEKAKAIHQWLNEGMAAQPAAQTAATPDGISIHTDENGEKWVRVKILDEDFLIAACIEEINAKLKEIGGEELEGYYWSSTEYSSLNAWYVNFSSGYISTYPKYPSLYVRPCAAFNN